VMLAMREEGEGDDKREAGDREAACGVVGFLDSEANMLPSRLFGRMPATNTATLKGQWGTEMFKALNQRPDPCRVAVADGAADNRTWLSNTLSPDVDVPDDWQGCQHLKTVSDAACGKDDRR